MYKTSGILVHTTCHRVRRILVRNLVLASCVGIHTHEHKFFQNIRINLNLTVQDTSDASNDSLETVVCYETILKKIRYITTNNHTNLLETLAEQIAAVCLQDTRVQTALVRIEKLHIFPDVESVGIEIERSQ